MNENWDKMKFAEAIKTLGESGLEGGVQSEESSYVTNRSASSKLQSISSTGNIRLPPLYLFWG